MEILKKVKVPDSVRVLPEMLLWRFENLESIELPSVLEGIGSQAFSYTKVGFGFKMNIENSQRVCAILELVHFMKGHI